jgi:spore coat polysaccharide biosynthesis predicted glycosyltransferase SpsG
MRPAHIIFAVAGYAAIGMGHFYRALMLAREFSGRRVSFFATRETESAALELARGAYPVFQQQGDDAAAEILALAPDLVINDLLDTDTAYMAALKQDGPAVVNFEDEGRGADLADLVVNALYEHGCGDDARFLRGHRYFCLRDEFLNARRNAFRPDMKRLLLTFGGTDPADYTRLSLEAVFPACLERGIRISIVAGPGYAHREDLEKLAGDMNREKELISFTHVSNVMSREMQGADAALCSAGRTVYELAHMRIPAVVLCQHEREERHTFAGTDTGFLVLEAARARQAAFVRNAFFSLLNPDIRHTLYKAASAHDFRSNKGQVIARIRSLLDA